MHLCFVSTLLHSELCVGQPPVQHLMTSIPYLAINLSSKPHQRCLELLGQVVQMTLDWVAVDTKTWESVRMWQRVMGPSHCCCCSHRTFLPPLCSELFQKYVLLDNNIYIHIQAPILADIGQTMTNFNMQESQVQITIGRDSHMICNWSSFNSWKLNLLQNPNPSLWVKTLWVLTCVCLLRIRLVNIQSLPDSVTMSRDVKPSAAKLATSVAALECDEGSRASASAADDTTPSFRPNSTIQSGPPCWKKKVPWDQKNYATPGLVGKKSIRQNHVTRICCKKVHETNTMWGGFTAEKFMRQKK